MDFNSISVYICYFLVALDLLWFYILANLMIASAIADAIYPYILEVTD